MGVNESAKYQLAKTFTELAIQNDLIDKRATATATAEEVKTAIGDTNFATGTGDAINYTAKSGKVYKVNINLTDYTVTSVEESK